MKVFLTKYETPMLQSLSSDGTDYILTLRITKFFGLISYTIKQNHVIPYNSSIKTVTKYWDNLIKTQEQLR